LEWDIEIINTNPKEINTCKIDYILFYYLYSYFKIINNLCKIDYILFDIQKLVK